MPETQQEVGARAKEITFTSPFMIADPSVHLPRFLSPIIGCPIATVYTRSGHDERH